MFVTRGGTHTYVLSFALLSCPDALGQVGIPACFVEEETEAQRGHGAGTCPQGWESPLPTTLVLLALRTWTASPVGRMCSRTWPGWVRRAKFIHESLKEVIFSHDCCLAGNSCHLEKRPGDRRTGWRRCPKYTTEGRFPCDAETASLGLRVHISHYKANKPTGRAL